MSENWPHPGQRHRWRGDTTHGYGRVPRSAIGRTDCRPDRGG
jgi:hypothetical protein